MLFSNEIAFILSYLNFSPDFLGMSEKRLDLKDKINFKNYDVTAWLTIDYNTPRAIFFCKNHAENEPGTSSTPLFVFF